MLLNQGQRIAILGLLLAVNQIFIVLASVIDVSSLTMMAVAAFVIGIAIYEFGLRSGAVFFVASCILGFILSPNKIYVVSYVMMGVYVLIKEFIDERFYARWKQWTRMGIKLLCMNVYFVPVLFFFPQVVLDPGEYQGMLLITWLLVQIVTVLCDLVYDRLIMVYHQRIRRHIRRK